MPIATPSTLRKRKLYYDITIASSGVGVINFCANTGIGSGASDSDRYGNVLAPNYYNGITSSVAATERRCKQAITAWFQPSSIVPGTLKSQREVCLDFIKQGGNITTQAGIDPTTEFRPRLRVRLMGGSGGASGSTFRGLIYIQRQHSIEI